MENPKLGIYYFSGTHWDREWYQDFQGFRYRLVNMVDELIDVLEKDVDFKVFHFDGQAIAIEDYLEIMPENTDRLKNLIKDGRILIGPWYVMPDEFLLSGESLIRNLMVGHQIAKKMGADAWKFGYVCDIFGHIAQMPQIFNGFNIEYALLGRGTNEHSSSAFFIWQSPDGSECITFKLPDNGGYGAFCSEVLGYPKTTYETVEELEPKIKAHIDYEKSRSDIPFVVLMDALDHNTVHPDVPKIIEVIKNLYPEADLHIENLCNMGEELKKFKPFMQLNEGELNEPAKVKAGYLHLITHTLSSRYLIKQTNDNCQTLLEKWVEPLTAMAAFAGFDTPKSYVDIAYRHLLQNHPHDSICGCSIDQIYKDMEYRFEQVKSISSLLVDECIHFELPMEDKSSHERLLILWNPLPFDRKEVVTLDIDFNTDYPERYQEPFGYEVKNSFRIYDLQGKEIPYGLVGIKKNQAIRRYNQFADAVDLYTVSFMVDMPAMSKAEYKLVPYKEASRYLKHMQCSDREASNDFIQLHINDNGTFDVIDKQTDKKYCSLASYIDDGEIGDGWYHANPAQDRIIYGSGLDCIIEKIESGPARVVFSITSKMNVPKQMNISEKGICRSDEYVEMKIVSKIGLSQNADYVDVETIITNNAKDHRVRLNLPTGIAADTYFANQAFCFVQRKTGIDYDTQSWRECAVPEKQMGGIVGKRNIDGTGLFFISAYGLHECAANDDASGSINITLFRSFNKTRLTNGEPGGQVQGDLSFRYIIKPIQTQSTFADLIRLQDCFSAGFKCRTIRTSTNTKLPVPKSFLKIENGNICMSILKRPEDGEKNKFIIRLYNMSDSDSTTKIECFMDIAEVTEVDLLEQYQNKLPSLGSSFQASLGAWKLQTYCIKF